MRLFKATRGNMSFGSVSAGLFMMALMITMCTATPSETGKSLAVGERGMLNSGGELTPVAIDKKTFEEWAKARVAKDARGQEGLIASGKIFAAEIGTTVLIIDTDTSGRKVKILNGPLEGRSGWVAVEHIR
jgi:hypothetical protein